MNEKRQPLKFATTLVANAVITNFLITAA
jgi:hypothetical protein